MANYFRVIKYIRKENPDGVRAEVEIESLLQLWHWYLLRYVGVCHVM